MGYTFSRTNAVITFELQQGTPAYSRKWNVTCGSILLRFDLRIDPMKYATLLGGLAILMASITAAVAAEVPAQYRGLWCDDSKGYYRCRKATSEAYLHIRRDGFNITEEPDCRVSAVTPSGKGHRLRMRCTGEPELVDVNLRLDARGRLHW